MILRIVADESVDVAIVTLLRKAGYEVAFIAEHNPGWPDHLVLEFAFSTDAFLITEDKDFGELTYRLRKPNHGILLVRLPALTGLSKAIPVLEAVQNYESALTMAFSVLDGRKLRIKPYSG